MKRKCSLALIALTAPVLGGCALQAAMAAAELAQYAPERQRTSNAHLAPTARQACTQRAAQHGAVYIVDVEQRRSDLIIVWGSVIDARQKRRTFECQFTTGVTRFRLRDI